MRSPVGFAASAVWPSGAATQSCGIASSSSSSAAEEVDDSEGAAAKRSSRSKTSTVVVEDEDEPPVIRNSDGIGNSPPGAAMDDYGLKELSMLSMEQEDLAEVEQLKRMSQLREYVKMEGKDPLELLLFAQDNFMRKDERMIPIPPHVREVMYRHRWDKALVDVRRSTARIRGLSTKKETYTAMVAVGNFQGLFGLGTASAPTAQLAVAQAYLNSYSQLTYIPLYRGHTLYHAIDHSFHELKMRLMPRKEGWGVKSSDLLCSLCAIIGIKNITIATFGRRVNKFYIAQCFMQALQKQSPAHEGAEASGMYLREVVAAKTLPFGLRRSADGTWKRPPTP